MDWKLVQKKMQSLNFHAMIKDHVKLSGNDALDIPKHLDRIFSNYELLIALNGKIIVNFSRVLSPEEMGLLTSMNVYVSIEGPLGAIIDILVFYFILEGHHDVWSDVKQEYVDKYGEVQRIPLYRKIKFLKHHNFTFIEKMCSRDIRNAIAHQNYSISKEGDLVIHRKKKNKIVKMKEMNKIIKNISRLLEIFLISFWSSIPAEERKTLPISDKIRNDMNSKMKK